MPPARVITRCGPCSASPNAPFSGLETPFGLECARSTIAGPLQVSNHLRRASGRTCEQELNKAQLRPLCFAKKYPLDRHMGWVRMIHTRELACMGDGRFFLRSDGMRKQKHLMWVVGLSVASAVFLVWGNPAQASLKCCNENGTCENEIPVDCWRIHGGDCESPRMCCFVGCPTTCENLDPDCCRDLGGVPARAGGMCTDPFVHCEEDCSPAGGAEPDAEVRP